MADASGSDRRGVTGGTTTGGTTAGGGTRPGVVPLIMQSWPAPGRVFRQLRGMPDRVLVVILMVAMLIFLVAQAPGHARAAQLDPSIPLAGRIAGAMFAVMFAMPLLCYLVAMLVAALSRLTPARITPENARLALFWALLAVSPAMLLSGLAEGLLGQGTALSLCRAAAGLGFLWIWFSGLWTLADRT